MMAQESNLLYFLEILGQCLSQDQKTSDHKPHLLGVHTQHITNAVQEPTKAKSRNMRTKTSPKQGVSTDLKHHFQIWNLLVFSINMAAFNWAPKKLFRVFHEILIKRPFECNIHRKRSLFSPSCPACLLPQT